MEMASRAVCPVPPTLGHKSACSVNGIVRKSHGEVRGGSVSYWSPKQSSTGSEHQEYQRTLSHGLDATNAGATPMYLLAYFRSFRGPGDSSQSTDRHCILTNSETRIQVPTGKCSLCVIRLKKISKP